MSNGGLILFSLLIIAVGIFLLWFFIFKVKHLKTSNVYCVDGGVKVGKSLICVMLAVKRIKLNIFRYYIRNFFKKIINVFRKNKIALDEKPVLYSNMPLYNIKYNPLTLDILLMKVRIPYRSVVLLDEASLIADAMSGYSGRASRSARAQFDYVNESLTLFLKTFGHQTHNGFCVFNSQSISDLHFSFKRCTSTYLFVSRNRKFPFFCLCDVREMINSEDNVQNVVNRDLEIDDRPLFVSKRYYKYYDSYYLDVLTKNLPLKADYDVGVLSQKNRIELQEIVTLGNFQMIKDYNERKLKENAKK